MASGNTISKWWFPSPRPSLLLVSFFHHPPLGLFSFFCGECHRKLSLRRDTVRGLPFSTAAFFFSFLCVLCFLFSPIIRADFFLFGVAGTRCAAPPFFPFFAPPFFRCISATVEHSLSLFGPFGTGGRPLFFFEVCAQRNDLLFLSVRP